MAVVSLSKIQIRRGRGNGQTSLPSKLASGELAWAIDDEQLWIGNGSLAEGAKTPGRTRILTEKDNIFDIVGMYRYKNAAEGSLLRGTVPRSLQDRLDDLVSFRAFDDQQTPGRTFADNFQTAITQLFSSATAIVAKAMVLYIEPGSYTIDNTIILPSNTKIQGAGIGRVIFNVAGTGPAFATADGATDVQISGFTLNHTTAVTLPDEDNVGLQLNSCKNSYFSSIELNGARSIGSNAYGIELKNSTTTNNTTENNTFDNIILNGQTFGVYSVDKIVNNLWTNCRFNDSLIGVQFGDNIKEYKYIYSDGNRYNAPQTNTISDSLFTNISQNAIRVARGTGNVSRNNKFYNVGNGANDSPICPVIEFVQDGNLTDGDWFERTIIMSDPANFSTKPYFPEVKGPGIYHNKFSNYVNLKKYTSDTKIFNVPAGDKKSVEIDYIYKNTEINVFRKGVLVITIDPTTRMYELSDVYEFTGNNEIYSDVLSFKVEATGNNSQSIMVDTLGILVLHSANDADFYYTIKATS